LNPPTLSLYPRLTLMPSRPNLLAVILGGGAGSRLFPLTEQRSKPAVPLGGKYRLVDVPISNCINSDVIRMFVLTQYNSASLNRHIATTYRFSPFADGFVEILAAEQTPDRPDWFQGTADAVRQVLPHIRDWRIDTLLILSGDHLYRMDYRKFLARHYETDADLTISVIPVAAQGEHLLASLCRRDVRGHMQHGGIHLLRGCGDGCRVGHIEDQRREVRAELRRKALGIRRPAHTAEHAKAPCDQDFDAAPANAGGCSRHDDGLHGANGAPRVAIACSAIRKAAAFHDWPGIPRGASVFP